MPAGGWAVKIQYRSCVLPSRYGQGHQKLRQQIRQQTPSTAARVESIFQSPGEASFVQTSLQGAQVQGTATIRLCCRCHRTTHVAESHTGVHAVLRFHKFHRFAHRRHGVLVQGTWLVGRVEHSQWDDI